MKKNDQEKTVKVSRNSITKFLDGDFNLAITLAELTEQAQSLDGDSDAK